MKFCSYCGRQLNEGEACSCPGALEEQEVKKNKFSKVPVNKIKKLAIPVAILLAIVITVICLVSYAQTEIDLDRYIAAPEVTGLNGQGVLSYSLDKAALYEVLVAEVDYAKLDENASEEDMAQMWEVYDLADKAMSGLKITASKETGLTNGDVVTIKASFNYTGKEKFPYHFKDASMEFTVSGLPEGKDLDAFADGVFTLSFMGFTGTGKAKLEVLAQDEVYELLRYEVSEVYNLKNGDAVTVKVKFDAKKLEQQGYFAPEVTEKSFVVEGLYEYVASATDIPAETLEEMERLLMEKMQARVDHNLDEDNVLVQAPVVLGSYFVTTGDPTVIHKDLWHGIEAQNAVIVLGRYATEETGLITFKNDTLVLLIFQNCYLDKTGALVYDDDPTELYTDHLGLEESKAYAQKVFGEYKLIPLSLYNPVMDGNESRSQESSPEPKKETYATGNKGVSESESPNKPEISIELENKADAPIGTINPENSKYAYGSYDHGYCEKCGRKRWVKWIPDGCFTFLSDMVCDCGVFVKAGECHHH